MQMLRMLQLTASYKKPNNQVTSHLMRVVRVPHMKRFTRQNILRNAAIPKYLRSIPFQKVLHVAAINSWRSLISDEFSRSGASVGGRGKSRIAFEGTVSVLGGIFPSGGTGFKFGLVVDAIISRWPTRPSVCWSAPLSFHSFRIRFTSLAIWLNIGRWNGSRAQQACRRVKSTGATCFGIIV